MEGETKTCPGCGEEWTLTEGERKWCEERDYKVPTRCKECRAKARAKREGEERDAA